jgi:hypothetical protein
MRHGKKALLKKGMRTRGSSITVANREASTAITAMPAVFSNVNPSGELINLIGLSSIPTSRKRSALARKAMTLQKVSIVSRVGLAIPMRFP